MKKNNKQKAFTLFELLVSISIIAILTAIASMSFSGAQKKARDARRIEDMNTMQKAAEQYYSFSNYTYPIITNGDGWTAANGQVVLDVLPVDPKNVAPNIYNVSILASSYCICATLENTTGGNSTSGNASCTTFVAGTGTYYCVKNQQ